MIERFSAKGIEFQFIDQVLEGVGKFFFEILDKLGQGGFRIRSGRWSKIIRKTKMNPVDLCHLLVRDSRQFRQRSFSIWHNPSQVLRASSHFAGRGGKPILRAETGLPGSAGAGPFLSAVMQFLSFDRECQRRDAPVPRSPQLFKRNQQIRFFIDFRDRRVQSSLT